MVIESKEPDVTERKTGSMLGNQESEALLALVAKRVRMARGSCGMSRRELSERSGVSSRYLAQLESGEGNISITVLQRISVALDHPMNWLLGEVDASNPELAVATELLRKADKASRDAVMQILKPAPIRSERARRICLIGLRGAGKSTLGKLYSEKAEIPFLELNKEIEEIAGMPVSEVMALYSQEGYRKLEALALDRIAQREDTIILAAAGGVVSEPATFSKLLARFNTIWITASPQEHMDRVLAQGDTRPVSGNPEAMNQLRSILASREALYARAQCQLDTSGKTVEAALERMIELIEEHRFLSPVYDRSSMLRW